MKKTLIIITLLLFYACTLETKKEATDFTTLFEKSDGKETPIYDQVIGYYQKLAKQYQEISLFEIG